MQSKHVVVTQACLAATVMYAFICRSSTTTKDQYFASCTVSASNFKMWDLNLHLIPSTCKSSCVT